MDHDKSETIFWYNILYSIGAHVMDVSEKFKELIRPADDNPEEDILLKIFCGYWILITLADKHGSDQNSKS